MLDIIFEDNHLLGVCKPAGLLTQAARAGDDNLVDRAKQDLKVRYDKPGNVFVGLVHRLDRNVSGVVLLAKTSKAAGRLTDAFRRRAVHKGYIAVVAGAPPPTGTLESRLGPRPGGQRGVCEDPSGKLARLRFTRLAAIPGLTVLAVVLETGRKHQIRAQLAFAGWPLLGDPLYGQRSDLIGRPALHAARLDLEHPVRREPLSLRCAPPPDLREVLVRCGHDFDSPIAWGFPGTG